MNGTETYFPKMRNEDIKSTTSSTFSNPITQRGVPEIKPRFKYVVPIPLLFIFPLTFYYNLSSNPPNPTTTTTKLMHLSQAFPKMTSILCCSNIQPYKSMAVDHQMKFNSFIDWAAFPHTSTTDSASKDEPLEMANESCYVIQLVRQINYGPVESKRYFLTSAKHAGKELFQEVTEKDLVAANYKKLNS